MRGRAYCEGYRKFADGYIVVDSLEYGGVSCRTVSGWKHSSTKAILAGVISLKSRLYPQNQILYISIGSGTVFIKRFGMSVA